MCPDVKAAQGNTCPQGCQESALTGGGIIPDIFVGLRGAVLDVALPRLRSPLLARLDLRALPPPRESCAKGGEGSGIIPDIFVGLRGAVLDVALPRLRSPLLARLDLRALPPPRESCAKGGEGSGIIPDIFVGLRGAVLDVALPRLRSPLLARAPVTRSKTFLFDSPPREGWPRSGRGGGFCFI